MKMKLYRVFYRFVLFAVVVATILSCASTGGATQTEAEPKEVEADAERPEWLVNHPRDRAYFMGIGSSNTGDESNDRNIARANAMSILAAAISTKVESEGTFTARLDKEGKAEKTAEVVINQTVNQNLKEVETVGAYYSKKSGAFHYVRLSKEKWAAIQEAEMNHLRTRVLELVLPILDNPKETVASKLPVLGKGWDIITATPYAGTVMSEMQGEKGSLLDLIEKRMGSLLGALSISLKPEMVVTEPGTSQKMEISVTASSGMQTGQLNIDILPKEGSDLVAKITTDQKGVFRGDVKLTETQILPIGKSALVAKLDTEALGIRLDVTKSKLIVPVKDFMVDVHQIAVGLKVQSESAEKITGLDGSIKALFSKDLPFKLSDQTAGNRFNLIFTLTFRDMPKNKFDMFITKTRGQISVERESRTIYSYETEEFKEAGLSAEQAKDRATLKLFDSLKEDEDFVNGLVNIFK